MVAPCNRREKDTNGVRERCKQHQNMVGQDVDKIILQSLSRSIQILKGIIISMHVFVWKRKHKILLLQSNDNWSHICLDTP